LANAILALSLAAAIITTVALSTSLFAPFAAVPVSPAEKTEVASTTTSFSSTYSTVVPGPSSQPLVLVYSLPQLSVFALLSWFVFGAALIWRGQVRSVWGKSRFSYDTFRLLVRMRGAQTRLRLMRSMGEPRNKLQLATALGLDWKAVDKHVQMLEKNGIIHVSATKGTATFYELTDKGNRLLQLLDDLGTDFQVNG
jgi:predicted transcriptional regulator